MCFLFFFFKQKTAYEMRISDWSSDVCSSDLRIVLYAGDNDFDPGRTPEQVRDDFRAFVARIRRDLPDVPIAWLAIKPSLARVDQLPAQQRANALVEAAAARMHDVDFIDVATPMLDADGRPRAELFLEDGLHMNRKGY